MCFVESAPPPEQPPEMHPEMHPEQHQKTEMEDGAVGGTDVLLAEEAE